MAKFVQPDKETFNLSAVQGQFPKKSWRASLFSLCLLPLQDTVSYARHRQALTKFPAVIIHMRTRLPSCIQRLNLRHAVAYFRIPRKLSPPTSHRQNRKNGFGSLFVISRRASSGGPTGKMRLNFRLLLFIQMNLKHNHPPVQRIFNIVTKLLKLCLISYLSHY